MGVSAAVYTLERDITTLLSGLFKFLAFPVVTSDLRSGGREFTKGRLVFMKAWRRRPGFAIVRAISVHCAPPGRPDMTARVLTDRSLALQDLYQSLESVYWVNRHILSSSILLVVLAALSFDFHLFCFT